MLINAADDSLNEALVAWHVETTVLLRHCNYQQEVHVGLLDRKCVSKHRGFLDEATLGPVEEILLISNHLIVRLAHNGNQEVEHGDQQHKQKEKKKNPVVAD